MAMMRKTLDELRRSERQFERVWSNDGLPDSFLGVYILAGGAALFAASRGWWQALVALFLAPLGVWVLGRTMWNVKTRVTDPRVGRARPRQFKLSRGRIVLLIIFGAAFNALVRAGTTWAKEALPAMSLWWPALVTMPIVLTLFVAWWMLRLNQHLVVGVAALLGALLGPLAGLRGLDSLALSYVLIGLPLLVGGLWAFRRFLRTTPRAEPV